MFVLGGFRLSIRSGRRQTEFAKRSIEKILIKIESKCSRQKSIIYYTLFGYQQPNKTLASEGLQESL